MDWIGFDWIGLDWIGLDWIGLDWIGFDRIVGRALTSGAQTLSFLVEAVQGPCADNQRVLADARVLDVCARLLGWSHVSLADRGITDEDPVVAGIRGKVATLLRALLEGPPDTVMAARVTGAIDFELLRSRVARLYRGSALRGGGSVQGRDGGGCAAPVCGPMCAPRATDAYPSAASAARRGSWATPCAARGARRTIGWARCSAPARSPSWTYTRCRLPRSRAGRCESASTSGS